MCREIIYWLAEIFNYWALTFWGVKLFVYEFKESDYIKKKRIYNMLIGFVSIPISVWIAGNYKYVIYSNVATYFLIVSFYIALKFIIRKKGKNVFCLTLIYIFCMRLIDLWSVTIITEISKISRYVNIDLTRMGTARVLFCLFLSFCYYYTYFLLTTKFTIIDYLTENTFYRRMICIYSYLGNLCFCTVYRFDYRDKLIGYWSLYLICAFVVFGTILLYSVKNKSKQKEVLLNMRNDMMESNYQGLKKVYEDNKILQHDYKNHLLAVSELVKENKKEEALNYIYTYISYVKNPFVNINSGNDIIDVILNTKVTEARKKMICFNYEIDYLGDISITDIDICALLANLLDNAIESCEKIDNHQSKISLNILVKNKMLIIQIINSISLSEKCKKNFFKSGKSNDQLHGWGMQSIERVISKYGGSKDYYINDTTIEFFINIPLE